MPDTLTCPVCERPGIPANSESCPQCDADLTCFQALDNLAEQGAASYPEGEKFSGSEKAAREDSRGSRCMIFLLLLLLVLIGSSSLFYILKIKDRVQDLKQRVVALKSDIQTAENRAAATEPRLCALPSMEKVHSAQEEEDSFAEDDPLIYAEDSENKDASEITGEHGERKGEDEDHDESALESVVESTSESAVASDAESAASALSEQDQSEQKSEEEAQTSGSMIDAVTESGTEEAEKELRQQGKEAVRSPETRKETLPVVKAAAVKKALHRSAENIASARASAQKEDSPADPPSAVPDSRSLPMQENWPEKTFLYLVKETDTLWDLAERFYGDGKYYPVIMEQNPGLVISRLHDEEILRLFNDRAVLKDIYSQRIELRNGLTLWKHQVLAGENRQTIEKRFASPGASGKVVYEKEPNIYPGALVRVILH